MEEFIARITKEAGEITKRYFKKAHNVRAKTERATNVVTDADIVANEFLVAEIKNHHPEHGFISEELGEENSDREWVWIIDPLDGTFNFSRHSPFYGTMVSLARNGVPEYGAVYLPIFDELYVAARCKGVTCNGALLDVISPPDSLAHSYGVTTAGSMKTMRSFAAARERDPNTSGFINNFGCSIFPAALVASGERDWVISNGSELWDHAAPACIMREVGCKVTNLSGEEWTTKDAHELVAAHSSIHRDILDIIKEPL